LGFDEICTFSFISPKYYDNIMLPEDSAMRKSVVISNPLGEDTSVMRTTALPSMLEILARNNNFSNESVSLFELATVYTPKSDEKIPTELPDETVKVVMGMYGGCDFYSLKGAVDSFLKTMSVDGGYSYAAETGNTVFHPGKCAKITSSDGKVIGVIGEIHPAVAEKYSLLKAYAAELDFDVIFALRNNAKQYVPLPKFPAVTRDFSFVCDESLEAGTIEAAISKAGIKLLESTKLFDIYRGPQVGDNKKSMSFSISLRAPDRTLKDEEADNAVKKLLKHLSNELGIALRA
jgi:Phenylalanyl-tRNA synthetase beta subunit